jgi:large subunit ribosomal protein L6
MSRVANNPVSLPSGVEVKLDGQALAVKGGKGSLELAVHSLVEVHLGYGVLTFASRNSSKESRAMSGTIRSLVSNMVTGVNEGFEKKLQLNGVGYRAKATGNTLNLTLGFSHPVDYDLPEGIVAETPSQTEIVIKGIDKQAVGQVAAEIRAFRPPEPYKGKGVRYADEHVRRKEAKKK